VRWLDSDLNQRWRRREPIQRLAAAFHGSPHDNSTAARRVGRNVSKTQAAFARVIGHSSNFLAAAHWKLYECTYFAARMPPGYAGLVADFL
jgi:hypothetical protein